MQYLHTNNASSNLRDPINPAATSVRVTSGQGTLFPNPGLDQGFFVTIEDRRTGRLEIALCTSRVTDTLTVTRGQQGTVPQSFPVGVNVSNRVTAQILNEFVAATVNEVPLARIPPIPDSKILNVSSSKLLGTVPAGLMPPITSAMIVDLDAAKLTGTIPDARLPNPLPAANLPVIPSSKITSMSADAITSGTLNPARLAANSIASAKISDLDAAKLTGTIADARLPAAMTATSLAVTTLAVSGNASIAGDVTGVDTLTASGIISGIIHHLDGGGYMRLGSYDTGTYGSGYARIWYRPNTTEVTFAGHVAGAIVVATAFSGNGAPIDGVVKSVVGIEGPQLLLGPVSGHNAGTIYAGTNLKTPHFAVNTSTNNLDITYTNGPTGNWRAMQDGTASSTARCLGQFVRIS